MQAHAAFLLLYLSPYVEYSQTLRLDLSILLKILSIDVS